MSEAGYTLTEMLTALAMIGLAMGGLSAGLGVLGRLQADDARSVADLNAVRLAQGGVTGVLRGEGPFRSRDAAGLKGDAGGFRFPCGDAAACDVRLVEDGAGRQLVQVAGAKGPPRRFRIPGTGPLAFSYVGAQGPSPAWPPGGSARQALRAVVLRRLHPVPNAQPDVFEVRIWREQPADCAFDVILQDCR